MFKNQKKIVHHKKPFDTFPDNVTKIIVKSKYSPIKGTTRDVDGIISVITNKKTVKVSRTEMHSVI